MNTEVIDAPEQGARTEIAEYTKTAAELANLRKRYENVVWDCSTAKGDKDARSVRMELVKLRTSLDKMRLNLNEADQDRIRKRNAEAKRITAEIAVLEEPVDAAIKAEEARREAEKQAKAEAEARRLERHQERIAAIRHIPPSAVSAMSSALEAHIRALVAVPTGPEFEEFQQQAETAKTEALAQLRTLRAAALEREAEAVRIAAERAELERLRTEQAAREKTERERIAAEQRAEAARLAAERRQLESEQAAARAEQKRLDDAAAAERRRADEEAAAVRAEADRIAREAREVEQHRLDVERAALLREQRETAEVARRDEEARKAAESRVRDAAPLMLEILEWLRRREDLPQLVVNQIDRAISAATGEPVNSDNGYYSPDGTLMNADGTRSVFDDIDDDDLPF